MTSRLLNIINFGTVYRYPLLFISKKFLNKLGEINNCFSFSIKACLPAAATTSNSGCTWNSNTWNKDLITMSDRYMWFEGVPFPTMGFTPELMREAWESFVFKDEDVLILTYPKSGKEAGSDAETSCGHVPHSLSKRMECFLYARQCAMLCGSRAGPWCHLHSEKRLQPGSYTVR